MLRVRDDCDSDLIMAKRQKDNVKQQLDSVADEVTSMNEQYENLKMESRDLQVTIGATKIDLKQIDKEIFELQQSIKIRQSELEGSDQTDDEDAMRGTGSTAENLDATQELINFAENSFTQENDLSFDQKLKDGNWRLGNKNNQQ